MAPHNTAHRCSYPLRNAPPYPPQTIISLPVQMHRVLRSGGWCVGGAGGYPTIRARIISPACVHPVVVTCSTPNDHFTAGPDCRLKGSGFGRVGRAGGYPTICAGMVSPASVQGVGSSSNSTPNDHFTVSPNRRVSWSRPEGALVVLVAVQLSVLGLYLPPVFQRWSELPS